MKENNHIPFNPITDSIIRDSIREANNYEHSKIVEPRHLLLAILRNGKNPVANWLSQLGLNYDRAIEMLYPSDKDDEQKTEEPKDLKMEPQTPDSETPAVDKQEEAENLEMAGGIEAEDDYNEQNDMMEPDEEPFDMEKDQNPMRLSTRSNGTPRKKSSTSYLEALSLQVLLNLAEACRSTVDSDFVVLLILIELVLYTVVNQVENHLVHIQPSLAFIISWFILLSIDR